jgi:kinetochore protein NNF1
LNAKLEESAQAEFEEILEEREAVKHLNDLDRLVAEAKVRKENGNGEGGGVNA